VRGPFRAGFKKPPSAKKELTMDSLAASVRREAGKHIAFLITHGFAARMMIRSGVAKGLTMRGARVTAITPNADESYFQQECQQENVTVRQQPKSAKRIANWFRAYRPYFLDDVMNNPALKSKHLSRFENHRIIGSYMATFNKTLARLPSFRSLMRAIEPRVNQSKEVLDLLRGLNPDLLVLPNPFGTEETLYLLHARQLGIPTVCQMLSWDNITTKGTPLLMPSYFISWGPIMTMEIVDSYHFPRERIYECGVPHFDVYSLKNQFIPRATLLQELKLPPDHPYLFYGMVAKIFCPNELEILTWLADQVNKNGFVKPCSLVIRPHPQTISGPWASNARELQKLKTLLGPRVALDIPSVLSQQLAWDLPKSDTTRLASLLGGCAMCLNAGSTLCLDACMLDRPVITIAFDGDEDLPYEKSARRALDYIHIAKLLALDGIRIARSYSELKKHINGYLYGPSLDQKSRLLSATQECGRPDGHSAERVVETLLTFAHEVKS
jgi:hypothetical protein